MLSKKRESFGTRCDLQAPLQIIILLIWLLRLLKSVNQMQDAEVRDCPERDIWSLGAMVQGSGQMGELLGRRRRRRRRRQLEIQV